MKNPQISYCIARTLQERMMFFDNQIEQVIKCKQQLKQNIGHFTLPLRELDRHITRLRAEQKRVRDLMTGVTPIQDAEYEIIN